MMAYEVVFWLSAALGVASIFYPWHPKWPGAKWLVHAPLLIFPLWALYEWVMPGHMNIRLDVPFIMFWVTVMMVLYTARLILFAFLKGRAVSHHSRP